MKCGCLNRFHKRWAVFNSKNLSQYDVSQLGWMFVSQSVVASCFIFLIARGASWSNGYGIELRHRRSWVQTPTFPKHFWFNGMVWRNGLTEETRNSLTEQFDEWFDGRALHSRFVLRILLCASRFMTSEVDEDADIWTRINEQT